MHTIQAVWEPTVTKYSWMEGKKSTKKLYRYSSELQISTKPLKISSNVTSSAHVASLVAFGAKLRENAMLSQVWRLTERSVLLNPAVDQSGWGGGANRFHTNAYEPNRYHQPRENPSHHFHSKHCWRILSVSLFFLKSLSQKEHILRQIQQSKV